MKRTKVIYAMALLLCIMAILSGCAKEEAELKIEPMQEEEVVTFGFDFLGGSDVMPISGYWGPTPQNLSVEGNNVYDSISEECMKNIADAGLNHINYSPFTFQSAMDYADKYLKLGEKYGIGITLNVGLKNIATVETADETLDKFSDYPAVSGVFVVDEPGYVNYFADPSRDLSLYVKYFDVLNELGYFPYCNLYPLYDADQREAYDEYLETYMTTCKPQVLGYDHYVFDSSNYINYFYNLSVIREKAEKYGVPFWCFIGTGTDWTKGQEMKKPTEYEFLWNINTCLAYGTKGIQYYPLLQNESDIKAEPYEDGISRIGLIGTYGAKTRFWHYAKRANEQIAAVDHVLMNSVNKGVLLTSEQARKDMVDAKYVLEGTSWRELTDVSGETMIGCFNYNGKSAFYVVNYSMEYAQKITLDFADDYKFTVIQNAETKHVKGESITLDMTAGEGVLVVVE